MSYSWTMRALNFSRLLAIHDQIRNSLRLPENAPSNQSHSFPASNRPFSNSSSSMILTTSRPSPNERSTSHPRRYASPLSDHLRNPSIVQFPYTLPRCVPSGYEPDSEDYSHIPNPGSKQALRFPQGMASMEILPECQDDYSSLKELEPSLRSQPAPTPPFISFKSFIKKQQEQAYFHSNAFPNSNPIHFDIKRKMKSRRKAHHVHSTSVLHKI